MLKRRAAASRTGTCAICFGVGGDSEVNRSHSVVKVIVAVKQKATPNGDVGDVDSDGDDDMGSEGKITAMANVMMLVKEAVRSGAAVVVVVAATVKVLAAMVCGVVGAAHNSSLLGGRESSELVPLPWQQFVIRNVARQLIPDN